MTVKRTPSGGVMIKASARDTWNWAHRPGASWPCSSLSGHKIMVELEKNGDLIDFTGPEDCDAHELRAFTDDALESHP